MKDRLYAFLFYVPALELAIPVVLGAICMMRG